MEQYVQGRGQHDAERGGVSSQSVKGDLPEQMTVEQSPAQLCGENSPGRGSHECKGPGAGRSAA